MPIITNWRFTLIETNSTWENSRLREHYSNILQFVTRLKHCYITKFYKTNSPNWLYLFLIYFPQNRRHELNIKQIDSSIQFSFFVRSTNCLIFRLKSPHSAAIKKILHSAGTAAAISMRSEISAFRSRRPDMTLMTRLQHGQLRSPRCTLNLKLDGNHRRLRWTRDVMVVSLSDFYG